MQNYLDLLSKIIKEGEPRADRTGTGTIEIFNHVMTFDMAEGFPLLTTKKMHLRSIIHELLWLISGSTNNNDLLKNGVTIWSEWADYDGNLGPIYGKQWRNVNGIDQLQDMIDKIKSNPTDRRLIVNSWNVAEIPQMRLPPCHLMYQCYVHNDGTLDLKWYQRSVDTFLGLPFNIASYALLLMIIARLTGLKPGRLIGDLACTHLYNNHIEQAKLQLERMPYRSPIMYLNSEITSDSKLDGITFEDFQLMDYQCHPHIKGDISI